MKTAKDSSPEEVTITEATNTEESFGDEVKPEKREWSIFLLNLGAAYMLYSSSTYSYLTTINALIQVVLFICTACIPAIRTGRMSYVDIAWPWGLFVIGVLTLACGEGYTMRKVMVGGCYILMGGRMGFGAFMAWRIGRLQTEFPRYEY